MCIMRKMLMNIANGYLIFEVENTRTDISNYDSYNRDYMDFYRKTN